MDNCANPVKETDVSRATGMLYASIEQLDGRVKLLQTRLSSVLLSKPKCCEQKKDTEITQCSLSKTIRGAVTQIDKIQSIVNDVLDDLEI